MVINVVGGNERDSAKRRRQDKYREELQLQMQEANAAKRRSVQKYGEVFLFCLKLFVLVCYLNIPMYGKSELKAGATICFQ